MLIKFLHYSSMHDALTRALPPLTAFTLESTSEEASASSARVEDSEVVVAYLLQLQGFIYCDICRHFARLFPSPVGNRLTRDLRQPWDSPIPPELRPCRWRWLDFV
jgi:hypothetical protein